MIAHPNLKKCIRDYPKQEMHFYKRARQLAREKGLSIYKLDLRQRMPSEVQLRDYATILGATMTELLGTTCEVEWCSEWHTDSDDR